jgi:predicted amidohydrolase
VTLRVALGEYDTGWHDPQRSLDRAEDVVRQAAEAGAKLVVLPETATTGFTMAQEQFEPSLAGSSAARLSAMAREHDVWIVAGLAVRTDEASERAHNVAALFSRDGRLATSYRKQRLFAYGGEHGSYVPGDAPVLHTIDGVRVALFICYDLRFPELFRPVAREVDAIVLIANWPATRRSHWDTLTRARAIENQCYVVAVNRTGDGGTLRYDGGSVVYGPWGELLASGTGIAELDAERVKSVRERFPFLP